ncbi:MAG: AAA family ATPase [Nitrosopumilaceae archaeon]
MKSLFITGTDTDVGKTYVTAGLAVTLRKMKVDVGIMKPFAAGKAQKKGYKSEDVEILSKAAQVCEPESLVNPQFFAMAASPYTASRSLKVKVKKASVISSFKKLSITEERYIRTMLAKGEKINQNPRISLSTIHAAKGGEADNVLILPDLSNAAVKS